METRRCTKCGEVKPLDEYGKKKTGKDGLQPRCKPCRREDRAEYYAENRDAALAYSAEYYQANRDAALAHRAEYYAENRDSIRAQQAEHRARPEVKARMAEHRARPEVKARKAEYMAEYYQANPHIWWEYAYRKRARAYGFDARVESFTREALIERWGPDCWHCGGPFEELDHLTPVAHGGPHTIENARPSCADCNRARSTVRTADILKEVSA